MKVWSIFLFDLPSECYSTSKCASLWLIFQVHKGHNCRRYWKDSLGNTLFLMFSLVCCSIRLLQSHIFIELNDLLEKLRRSIYNLISIFKGIDNNIVSGYGQHIIVSNLFVLMNQEASTLVAAQVLSISHSPSWFLHTSFLHILRIYFNLSSLRYLLLVVPYRYSEAEQERRSGTNVS